MSRKLNIYDNDKETTKSIKLLGFKISHQLSKFNQHIATFCSKAAMQLNAPSRLRRFVGKAEKAAILNRSVYASFHMPALVWHFCLFESSRNLRAFSNVALVLNMMTAKVIMKLYQRKGNL